MSLPERIEAAIEQAEQRATYIASHSHDESAVLLAKQVLRAAEVDRAELTSEPCAIGATCPVLRRLAARYGVSDG